MAQNNAQNNCESEKGNGSLIGVKELLAEEEKYIRRIREQNTLNDQPAGLAFSGGGIRSASFALGAIQALHNIGLLNKFDYLSTVSGGGYIGSCLTWFLHKIHHAQNTTYPLGEQTREGARSDKNADVLDYLRLNSNYLTPGKGLDLISAIGIVVRSMILGFLVYFPLLVAFFFIILVNGEKCGWLIEYSNSLLGLGYAQTKSDACFSAFFLSPAAVLLSVFLLSAVFYSLGTWVSGNSSIFYRLRTEAQKWTGLLLTSLLLLTVAGTLPLVASLIPDDFEAWVAALTTIFGYVVAICKVWKATQTGTDKESKLSGFMGSIAAILLIYGLLLGGYLVASQMTRQETIPLWLAGIPVLSLVTGLLVNLNYVSLHRMYRDRLMELFLPDEKTVRKCTWQPASEANSKKLHEFHISDDEQKKFPGPYHIINTNLIQVDAEGAKYRGRGGDSFILTPLYCGSNATGWRCTEQFNGGTMTLATAMAVSGAAVNPHAGVSGRGPTRNRLVSFLMSFLNIRLGYWARNPRSTRMMWIKPNYFYPGVWKGLLGMGFDEKSICIELSDGGHFENLAVYELIRRRVKTVIVTDGGADPEFNFSDLANLVERVRVDFGVEIDFAGFNAPMCDLLPGSGCAISEYKKKYDLAKRGYAIGKIRYPQTQEHEALEGTIYYIKTTLTGGLPEDIYGYKSAHKDFPDETTADQFFDEAQFEAYRELGYQITKKMLAETGVLQNGQGAVIKGCPNEEENGSGQLQN